MNRIIMMMVGQTVTNLARHPNKQFRNPAGWIDGIKRFLKDTGDGRWGGPRELYMRAERHIKLIEVREKFWTWGRFQALFREHCPEGGPGFKFLITCIPVNYYQKQDSACVRKWNVNWNDYLRVGPWVVLWSYWQYFDGKCQNLKRKCPRNVNGP